MIMKIQKSFLLLLLFAGVGLSGCSVVDTIESLEGILEDVPEIGQLKDAEYAFFIGEYEVAKDIYMEIQRDTEREKYRNSAVYGLACISIITATNSDELKNGYAMFKEWEEPQKKNSLYLENPKMIIAALNEQVDLLECHPEIRYVTTKKEGDLVKTCREEVQELKVTIEKLEHQISVLEAIDQEIQEKRNPL